MNIVINPLFVYSSSGLFRLFHRMSLLHDIAVFRFVFFMSCIAVTLMWMSNPHKSIKSKSTTVDSKLAALFLRALAHSLTISVLVMFYTMKVISSVVRIRSSNMISSPPMSVRFNTVLLLTVACSGE